MKLVPLAGRPEEAVRVALLSHGWEGDLSRSTADALESLAYHLTEAAAPTLEALVTAGSRLGVDVITGDDWALLAGSRARLSALARPWTSPEPLQELAAVLGHALPAEDPTLWQTAVGPIVLDRPRIVGILNLTPDSFSDAGRLDSVDAAVERAEQLLAEGASILDIGGESTRPGAVPVSAAEELRRVVPSIAAILRRFPDSVVSVDTVKANVARAALDSGAAIVNDVSGFRLDPALPALCAERKAGVILMHSRGGAGELASLDPAGFPGGVLPEVLAELAQSVARARAAGVGPEYLVLDPGLGFGKTPEQNVELLRGLRGFRMLGRPVLVGPSRKRFLGQLTGRAVEDRDVATAAACALAWDAGARLFRVHEPGPTRDALAIASAMSLR
ncbi:MAG TPA: dihydropteroate synthase [Gemmatimonadales bacterium]|nr:dihydropteroate synthase [Gemmatimonadales bacterium]